MTPLPLRRHSLWTAPKEKSKVNQLRSHFDFEKTAQKYSVERAALRTCATCIAGVASMWQQCQLSGQKIKLFKMQNYDELLTGAELIAKVVKPPYNDALVFYP